MTEIHVRVSFSESIQAISAMLNGNRQSQINRILFLCLIYVMSRYSSILYNKDAAEWGMIACLGDKL